jgi:hypothetical protein
VQNLKEVIINELKLPDSFVELIRENTFQPNIKATLRENVDAFGNFLETEIGSIYESEDAIIRETNLLPEHFVLDGCYGEPGDSDSEPGFIPDIVDFSNIICFGASGDGAPFCFDYRDNLKEPGVIWWADVYWRRIAPDFDSFLELFNLRNNS